MPAINHIIKSIINRGNIAVASAVCDIKDIEETVKKCNADCAVICDITAGRNFSLPRCLAEIPVVLVTNNPDIINQPKKYGLFSAIKSSSGGSTGLALFERQLNDALETIYSSRKKVPHINESYDASAKKPKDIAVRQRFIDLNTEDEKAVNQQFIDLGTDSAAQKRQKPSHAVKTQSEGGSLGGREIELIAIGASTGGTDAIIEVVKNLPVDTPPVVIVQHMPEGFTKMYSDRLDRICKMSAKEAEDGDRLRQGLIIVAHGARQMEVNGMSPSNRGGQWSNSGMVVELRPEDIEGDGPLKMMHFQEKVEADCWQQGNMKQTAPAQRMVDFVNGKLSYDLPRSSYAPGLISSPLHFWMPDHVSRRLREGFKFFGNKSRGFLTNEAVVIAVETRTSSPVRILRTPDTLMHIRLRGLFPCGEGAGYAGGIVSAGVDGERCADSCAEYISTLS